MKLARPTYWNSKGILSWLLFPVSLVFQVVSYIRVCLYRFGLLSSWRSPVPVVVVGNITVGGAGKSPLVIALTELLTQNNISVGIVSRGYGGTAANNPVLVTPASDPSEVGDECVMIAKRTSVPVVACADRVAAVKHLLSVSSPDVVISDDGMQHYRLQRDLEIAVVDTVTGFGNQFCLPAGPLREPVVRLKSVDMVVYSGTGRQASGYELQGDIAVSLEAANATDTSKRVALASFTSTPVHAVAGIAFPQRFFAYLRAQGLQVIEHPGQDHAVYNHKDFQFEDGLPVLVTEKDAVKLRTLDLQNCWYVPVTAMIDEPVTKEFLMRIEQLISKSTT